MAPSTPRLRILSVGGNAVSAFLSWRLQATNACDVTLVWKSGFEDVSQYGISFKSKLFGNERFKPHAVVRTPDDASQLSKVPFDYVLLCVKALPDVYDLATIIESVVSPQHTCILINTTHSLGVETYLEQRFPTNVVLSLVSGAEISQLGASEFEHKGATDIWVGPANKNASIPQSIQSDMAEALAMTLSSGQVDCRVSENIRQQQFERMIGPIAFHPASVIFECPSHAELLEKTGVRLLVSGIIDELLNLAQAHACTFPADFREKTMEDMIKPTESHSIMYKDFTARVPMEVETYLGSPIKLAQLVNVAVPRVEALYAVLYNLNIVNQTRPEGPASPSMQLPPRVSSARGAMNGGPPMKNGMTPRGSRAPSMNGPPPPHMRRGPPNGFPPRGPPNGFYPNGQAGMNKRPSFEGNDLEEFSHVMLYDAMPEEGQNGFYADGMATPSTNDLALRERELMLRQKELALREQEYSMRRHQQPRMPHTAHVAGFDDDEDDDYFDPMEVRPGQRPVDDNFDMMSVTSRRNRRGGGRPSLDAGGMPPNARGRNGFRQQNRASTRLMSDIPNVGDSIMNNSLMGYSSNRYGGVDRQALGQESRSNSLTAAKLDEFQRGSGGGGYNGNGGYPPMPRRASQSPGNPLSPGLGPRPPGGRPSPPNGYPSMNGANGVRPSPPNGMRQPVPRHPPGHGNAVAPHQVEQHVGRGEW